MSRAEALLMIAVLACWVAAGLAWAAWLKINRLLGKFMKGPPS